jgi:3-oxoacyl-[acyl-carrier protein] reductase
MFDFTGKKVLITGASGGIGSTIAQVLHGQGATVGLSGTRIDALQQQQEILKDRCHLFPHNLSELSTLDSLVKQAEETMGGIDILINNAGITRDTLAMRMKDEDWDAVLNVNLGACFRLCRGVLRGMMKQRYGRIINISSIVGVMGNPGQTNYAASKAGMIGMSKSLAAEVASRGITVNCIAPGFIETPMTHALTGEQKNQLLTKIPSGSLGTPADIGNAVVYLASQEARYITGQTLHINGGMLMI